MDERMYWYNFVTKEYDLRETPTTDDEAKQYIPQRSGVALYEIYREHKGMNILESMRRVLEAAVGEK